MAEVATAPVGHLIDIPCDVARTFDFKIKETPITGYILSGKLKDDPLEADWGVKDPENPTGEIKVVAVLEHITWSGKATDPITFVGRMSTKNREIYNDWRAKQEGGSDVSINFVVKEYDDNAKQYYKSFHSQGAEINFMTTETNPPSMKQKCEAKPEKPKNYQFTLCLSPKSEGGVQMLGYATSTSRKRSVELGIAAG